MSFSFI